MEKGKNSGSLRTAFGWVLVIFGAILLVIGLIFYFSGVSDDSFLNDELPNWEETQGVFLDFHLEDSGVRSSSDPDDDDYKWWVTFSYTLEYEVSDAKMTVVDQIKREGTNSRREVPEDKLVPPHYTGEETYVVYDPNNLKDYRIGSMEHVTTMYQESAESSALLSRIMTPFGLVLLVFGILLLVSGRRARKKALQANPLTGFPTDQPVGIPVYPPGSPQAYRPADPSEYAPPVNSPQTYQPADPSDYPPRK